MDSALSKKARAKRRLALIALTVKRSGVASIPQTPTVPKPVFVSRRNQMELYARAG